MIVSLKELARAIKQLYPNNKYDNHIKFMGTPNHIYATEFRTYNKNYKLVARADISELNFDNIVKYGGASYISFGYNKINDLINVYSNEEPNEKERPKQFTYSLSENEIPVYKEIFQ